MAKQMSLLYTHNLRRRRHRYNISVTFPPPGLAGGADVLDVLTSTTPLSLTSTSFTTTASLILLRGRLILAALGDGDNGKAAVGRPEITATTLLMEYSTLHSKSNATPPLDPIPNVDPSVEENIQDLDSQLRVIPPPLAAKE